MENIPEERHVAVARIREATIGDAQEIAGLSDALGYPASSQKVAARLDRLRSRERDIVLVAEDGGELIGWIHGSELDLLETGRRCEILGLVVDESHRGRGVGRMLVEAVENWAKQRGLDMISVRSNVIRPESHPFYERMGYLRAKTQHVYRKKIQN